MYNSTGIVERIGLDKTAITNFKINHIDIAYLNTLGIELVTDTNSLLKSGNGIGIARVKIKDKYFGKLECGMSNANPQKQYRAYTRLELLINKDNNLQNLTVAEYKLRIISVFAYIKNRYNIDIAYDFDTLQLSYMEINCTFKLTHNFSLYKRALIILMSNLPEEKYISKNWHKIKCKTFTEINTEYNCASLETLSVGNSSIELTIYNKTKQLKDLKNINLPYDYIRIEYKLKRKDSRINTLGGTVGSLSDKKIRDFYIDNFQKDIINGYEKYSNKISSLFEPVLIPLLAKSDKQWYKDFIRKVREYESKNGLPMLIDIADIFPILKDYSKQNYSRRKKMVMIKAQESETDLIGVRDKINEIICKVNSFAE
jgi:hypothetical protein